MHHGGQKVVWVGWAARNGHHRLAQHVGHAGSAGGVAARRGHAAPGRTGADGDHGGGIGGALLDQINGLGATNLAVNAVVLDRNGPFDHQHILALVGFHGVFACGLGLVSGSGHQGFVVVERDHVQNQFFKRRVLSPQQGFRAAGALLKVQPDHRWAFGRFDGFGHGRISAFGQAHGDGQGGTKLQVVAPRHAQTVLDALQGIAPKLKNFAHIAHVVSSYSRVTHRPDQSRNRNLRANLKKHGLT